jgi:hypothetical protein
VTATDEALEEHFIRLVRESWGRYGAIERATWLDDAFIGGLIASHLDGGLFLLDLASDGVSHSLMFSDSERRRYITRLNHGRAEDFAFAKNVGHLASVEVGFSAAYPDISKIWTAVKSEVKSGLTGDGRIEGYPDPGVMRIDATGTFATCQTALLVDLKDYVAVDTLACDHEKIWIHWSAAYASLRKYLEGIMK